MLTTPPRYLGSAVSVSPLMYCVSNLINLTVVTVPLNTVIFAMAPDPDPPDNGTLEYICVPEFGLYPDPPDVNVIVKLNPLTLNASTVPCTPEVV